MTLPLRVLCLALVSMSPALSIAQAPSAWDAFVKRAAARHQDVGERAATFLAAHRPKGDENLAATLLDENLDLALLARTEFPWAKNVPEEIYFNDVLPYAVFDETRESWRPRLWKLGRDIVKDCQTATEAAQALNLHLFQRLNVHYNTKRKRPNQSPSESIEQGVASCTGLSILLIDACRAVGVPARGAGVFSWNGKRGNHTWVEVWDGEWHFTGADEFDAKGLDRAWFVADARRAVRGDRELAVWATSYRPTGSHFPLVWNRALEDVPGVDVSERYASASARSALRSRSIRAWDRKGGERIETAVTVWSDEGASVGALRTLAGRHDLNDMATVELEPGKSYRVTLERDGASRVTVLGPATAGATTHDLYWDGLGLDRKEAESYLARRWEDRKSALITELEPELAAGKIAGDAHALRFLEKTFGEPPAAGRSLWISLHGGGQAPAPVNERQWKNQLGLYQPQEGIYVAPRAPTDTWNLWHQGHIDALFDRLIAAFVAVRGVDPQRVYLLGYSAGGDGVYQLAPRMADRFAAAAMMAGHPNESGPLGLRNLPFAIFVGGKDSAFKRNDVAAAWGKELASLQKKDPKGYAHRVTIYPECGHWMDRKDAEALPWMAPHTRDPWPSRIVWKQDDVVHARFYWLSVSKDDARVGMTVTAEVTGNTVALEGSRPKSLTLRLHDRLLDLDKPVVVTHEGREIFRGVVLRTTEAVDRSLTERQDPHTAATALLTLPQE